MLDFLNDASIVIIRVATILPLLLFATKFMGRRTVGEVPIFDFLVIIILGSVVGADIADPEMHHFPTVVAIIAIAMLQKVVAHLKISHRKFEKYVTFDPIIVIHNGKILANNLKKIQYTIENILQMLREKDIFDVQDVEIGIIESSGNLSILKKSNKIEVTIEDLNLPIPQTALALPIIIDGEIQKDILSHFKVDEAWLSEKLWSISIKDPKQIFFASLNAKLELHVSLKNESSPLPPIRF